MHALIQDIFSPEGSEMHIKDIRLYAHEVSPLAPLHSIYL